MSADAPKPEPEDPEEEEAQRAFDEAYAADLAARAARERLPDLPPLPGDTPAAKPEEDQPLEVDAATLLAPIDEAEADLASLLMPIAESDDAPSDTPFVLSQMPEPEPPTGEAFRVPEAVAAPPGEGTAPLEVAGGQASRLERQRLAELLVSALHAVQRNARTHAENNNVYRTTLGAAGEAIAQLVQQDGSFELRTAGDTTYVNRQALRFDRKLLAVAASVQREFVFRGITGLAASAEVPDEDLRSLVAVFAPGAGRPGPTGHEDRPLKVLRLLVEVPPPELVEVDETPIAERLATAYAGAVRYVARYVDVLRRGGEALPVWGAARLAMDLVDLQRIAPESFVKLARTKHQGEAYWAFHSVNVAVLAVSLAAGVRLPRRRRHELAMAALFHDVGIAALPPGLLENKGALDDREREAVQSAPLFAARAVLREREAHVAGLGRALAVYEAHRHSKDAGTLGPVVRLCEVFDALTSDRPFRAAMSVDAALEIMRTDTTVDARLVPLLAQAVGPLRPYERNDWA